MLWSSDCSTRGKMIRRQDVAGQAERVTALCLPQRLEEGGEVGRLGADDVAVGAAVGQVGDEAVGAGSGERGLREFTGCGPALQAQTELTSFPPFPPVSWCPWVLCGAAGWLRDGVVRGQASPSAAKRSPGEPDAFLR